MMDEGMVDAEGGMVGMGGGDGYTGASLEGQSMVDYCNWGCNWGCNGKNRKQGAEEEKVK